MPTLHVIGYCTLCFILGILWGYAFRGKENKLLRKALDEINSKLPKKP